MYDNIFNDNGFTTYVYLISAYCCKTHCSSVTQEKLILVTAWNVELGPRIV